MRKKLICILVTAVLLAALCFQTFAAGDVSTAIENTWKAAQTQIKNVVNNVVSRHLRSNCRSPSRKRQTIPSGSNS